MTIKTDKRKRKELTNILKSVFYLAVSFEPDILDDHFKSEQALIDAIAMACEHGVAWGNNVRFDKAVSVIEFNKLLSALGLEKDKK